jgi:hypothetical protein
MNPVTFIKNYPLSSLDILENAPKNAIAGPIAFKIGEISSLDKKRGALLLEEVNKLPYESRLIHNGSFHAWDLNLVCMFEGKTLNLFEVYGPKGGYTSPTEYPEETYDFFTIMYVPKEIYNFLKNKDLDKIYVESSLYMRYIHRQWESDSYLVLKDLLSETTAADFLESIKEKAIKYWKMSRKHEETRMKESIFLEKEAVLPEEDTDDDNNQIWTMLLYGRDRYNSSEVRPKNWNGTEWI